MPCAVWGGNSLLEGAWQLSCPPCVRHVNAIWSCLWVLTPHLARAAYTCFRLGTKKKKKKTAGFYLCEFTESTGQLHQHASFLSFHRLTLGPGCFGPYITALRQRADFIWKYTDGGDPVRCLRGVRVGTLELRSVSARETDITATHICFKAFVRNEISFSLSSFYCISPVRWDVWSELLVQW